MRRQVPTNCSEVIALSAKLVQTINADPSDASIFTISAEISSVDSSVVCDSDQQALLAKTAIDMKNATEEIKTALSQVLEVLDELTGSTPSAGDLLDPSSDDTTTADDPTTADDTTTADVITTADTTTTTASTALTTAASTASTTTAS